jgi:thiol-disulfide isomerase/thioredoxin
LNRIILCVALLTSMVATAVAAPGEERTANRLLNRAMQELARYELDAAVATLGEVLDITPNDGFARSRLAEVLAVGLGRGAETSASYRALAAAAPDQAILRVWVVRAEMARHVEDRWVVADRAWVAEAIVELEKLAQDRSAEVRYAASLALRDLLHRMGDGDGARAAGDAAAAIFPDRLQARVSGMITARADGNIRRFRALCKEVIRATPGAVEACSMLFAGSSWADQAALERAGAAVLRDVARLGDRVLGDPVLAHEVAKFYGRPGVPPELQAEYVARILERHPDFRLAVGSRWWRNAPPPIETSRRRIRDTQGSALDRLAVTPRNAPWIFEEQASRAASIGHGEDALGHIRSAVDALTVLPYTPTARRPPISLDEWTEDRARDLGRMLALEARILRMLSRSDDAWPTAHRAAALHDDGHTWVELAQFAAVRGEATVAAEADLEGISRLTTAELEALPAEYRERAAERFTAAQPQGSLAEDQAWAALRSAAGARRAERRGSTRRPEPRGPETHPLVGRPSPTIDVATLNGDRLASADLQGRVVIVDFWATWCLACKRAMPELQGARENLDDRVVILALSVDEGLDEVESFMARSRYTFDVAHVGPTGQVPWLVRGIPSTFVIDAQGTVRHHHQGYRRGVGRLIEEEVRALLNE